MSRAMALSVFCLAGCGDAGGDSSSYRYPSPAHSAALRVDIHDYGGAAGFVRNEISLEAAGWTTGTFATLEHMSDVRVVWLDESHARFCYVGARDHGEPRWSGLLNGKAYVVDLVDTTNGAACA